MLKSSCRKLQTHDALKSKKEGDDIELSTTQAEHPNGSRHKTGSQGDDNVDCTENTGDEATPDACAICLDPFALDDTVTNGSSCEHEFHHKCLLDWLNSRARPKECPTCRAPLWDQNKYDNVFQGMQDVNRVDGVSKSSERKRAHNLGV
uniref:RING-type domain-containing protein n=1 Tax=Grammatophora oceanica TaxID=210454 RepID=A0A7S1VM26_9STRA|mmetsp:Transcript_48734/g.72774  ORF Transcript_48734/g.72774 Transcript_48734/m.72774 type:complete len:149 (+) Transcript_48734:316-762(+)